MKKLIFEQIQQAFNATPTLDGVIHGKRKIKQGKHGSRSSLFYSAKNQAYIPVESRLERDYCYQLEADREVKRYRTQSLEIPFRGRHLYPDFLILDFNDTTAVKEVKPFVLASAERTVTNAQYLTNVFNEVGIRYSVVTERDLWSGPAKRNHVMLYDRGGRLAPTQELCQKVIDIVVSLDPASRTIARVRIEIARSKSPSYLLEAALFNGTLSCDMTRAITSLSKLEVAL